MIRTLLAGLLLTAATPAAAPALHVTQSTDLVAGQKIVVNGTGFRPGLPAVAVGVCRQGYTNGLNDCDLDGGAKFVNIDSHGRLPTVTLTLHTSFKGIDCTVRQCVIGVGPLPGTQPDAVRAANSVNLAIGFKGSTIKGAASPTPAVAAALSTGSNELDGPSPLLWALTLAALLIIGGVALTNTRRR